MGFRIADAYAQWFKGYDEIWSHYATLTFRLQGNKSGSMHPEQGNKHFKRWLNDLNVTVYGKKYQKHPRAGVLVARATEIGTRGGLLHYHALLGHLPVEVIRNDMKDRWNEIAGFAKVQLYDKALGGCHYMAKSAYAFKRGEIDFLGPWDQLEAIRQESYATPALFNSGEAQV